MLDDEMIQLSRTVLGIWDILGFVGGIQQVLFVMAAYTLGKYDEISFNVEAINEMYIIKTKDPTLNLSND